MASFNASSLLSRIPGGWKTLIVIVVAFLFGFLLRGGGDASAGASSTPSTAPSKDAAPTLYTCSMHPSIRLADPNARCPICGMELIPVKGGGGDDDAPARQLRMSESARVLADVQTATAERRFVVKEVRMVGMVDYDETRQRTITAWVPGRLDRLYVDYTGVAVQKGAPLVYMYSPELLVAQQALLKADEAYAKMAAARIDAKNLDLQRSTVVALEDRLRLWGLSDAQIAEIRSRGSASDHMTILSPISGIVIHKNSVEGEYVKTGSKIYEIADLSRIWVYLDAYESDLTWIRYAQEVQFEAEAYPGDFFRGRISFIDPFLDKMTRTVKVRVTVENVDGRLKPGMFVRARVQSTLARGDRIVETFLAGKWISPVHPEVVLDEPGDCPICGTPLVSAASLGYVGEEATPPLAVPATAPLRTGRRALVYVRIPDADQPTFEGREVVLGARTRDHYIIKEGLLEGERVVVKGNFKIDSALQILAKPSMMSPPKDGEAGPRINAPSGFVASLSPLLHAYLGVQGALANDDLEEARRSARVLASAVDGSEMRLLAGDAHKRWMELRSEIVASATLCADETDVERARAAFEKLSGAVLGTIRAFGQATGADLYETHCPMAFDKRGASWLADSEEVRNPYYGTKMLDCGAVRDTFRSEGVGPRVNAAFRRGLTPFFDALVRVQVALAADDLAKARAAAGLASRALDGMATSPGQTWLDDIWSQLRSRGADRSDRLQRATDLELARAAFESISGVGLALIRRFGHAGQEALKEAFCPMAFDNQGAFWLQHGDEIVNPYLGSRMPHCGEIRATFVPIRTRAIPQAFLSQISAVVNAYLATGESLHGDRLEDALRGASAMDDALAGVDAGALERDEREAWRGHTRALRDALGTLAKTATIEEARRLFALVSESLVEVLARFGHADHGELVEVRCGMAFGDRGAIWIQRGEEIRNPYFGAVMPQCGEVKRKLPSQPGDD